MPLSKLLNINDCTQLIIWTISEPEQYFTSKLSLSEQELENIAEMTPKRRKEWLLPRYICSLFHPEFQLSIAKDEYSKPYLKDDDRKISISHSKEEFAMLISDRNCGIDIQYYTPKIERIARKFVNPKEEELLAEEPPNMRYHMVWSAKEALYKLYGRKKLDFREHIKLTEQIDNTTMAGRVTKEDFTKDYKLHFQKEENYIIVYGFEDI